MNYRSNDLRSTTIVFTLLLTSGILLLTYLLICAREVDSFSKLIDDKVELETRIASSLIQQNYGLGNVVELRRTLQTLSESLGHHEAVFKNDAGEVLWQYAPEAAAPARRKVLNRLLLPLVLKLARRPVQPVTINGEFASCKVNVEFSGGVPLGEFSWVFSIDEAAGEVIQRLAVVLATFVFLTLFLTVLAYLVTDKILKPLPELTEKIRNEFVRIGVEYKDIDASDISFIGSSFDDLMRGWKTSQEKLLQASKLAAIGQTAGMLAHDVRRPFAMLKSMLATIDVLKNNPSELGKAKADVSKAIRQVESMISDIMDFSREIDLEKKPQGMAAILDFSIRQAAHGHAGPDISFRYDLRNTFKPLVDEERVSRVFSNILSNAIEAISILGGKTAGEITITSRDAGAEDARAIEIVIGNDGPPVLEEDMPRLFESFFTKGKQRGTGLGLASAKKIVELHGGSVFARNRPGGAGVEFVVRLPASMEREEAAAAALPGNIAETLSQQRKQEDAVIDSALARLNRSGCGVIKMLILEDETLYRAAVRNTIRKSEELHRMLTLYEAKTVADAIQLIEKEDIRYAIVDIDLGDKKNGFDFLAELRDRFPGVAAMVHSNRTMKEDFEKAAALGAKSFVPKPLAMEHLVSFLISALPPAETGKGRVVLACDDDALARRCIGMTLKAELKDADVHVFSGGEALLAKFRELAAQDGGAEYIVFTDQNMGGMSGLELTAALRELNVPCKIYVVSNEPKSEFAPRALKAGADAYYEGPLDADLLARILN